MYHTLRNEIHGHDNSRLGLHTVFPMHVLFLSFTAYFNLSLSLGLLVSVFNLSQQIGKGIFAKYPPKVPAACCCFCWSVHLLSVLSAAYLSNCI